MKLTNEEAFAIRYHMGFSGTEDARNVGAAFEKVVSGEIVPAANFNGLTPDAFTGL